jgi:hypothetical protein
MSLIVPVGPVAKIGSCPDTRKVVVVVPEHVEDPENAMHWSGTLVTPSSDPVWLLLISVPPPPNGMGVANIFAGAMAINANAIDPKPAILRPAAERVKLVILLFFLLRLGLSGISIPVFEYAIASRACLGE